MDLRIVSVDLGGTQIRAALCTPLGELLTVHRLHTPAEQGPDAVVSQIVDAIRVVTGSFTARDVLAVVIGSPGPLDPRTGIILATPNLPGFGRFPLRQRVQDAIGLPVRLENDATLAALGEHRFGAGQGINDLAYITVSTGIGGGLISDSRVIHGFRGIAGELGHVIIDPEGPLCPCGRQGCLEAIASGTAIVRQAREAMAAGEPTTLRERTVGPETTTELDAAMVAEAARQGDALSQRLYRRAGVSIGLALVGLINLLDPQRIVIGGGVSRSGELLFSPIRETVHRYTRPMFLEGLEIVPAALGDNAGLLGGVALAVDPALGIVDG